MTRFLYSPAIRFIDNLVCWLDAHAETTTDERRRVFVRPITDGIRMNNMGVSLSLDVIIQGNTVTLEPTVDNVCQMDKITTYQRDEVAKVGETILKFFSQE